MRPTKLSSQVFLDLPPVLSHFIESARSTWLECSPPAGRISLLNRPGVFTDIESLAVERRHLLEAFGMARTRAYCFRMGFEVGRREALRHLATYEENARLALQAGPVFGQLQGRYVAEPVRFEFDLDEGVLYREVLLHSSCEALAHQMVQEEVSQPVCWTTTGYLSGHVSEIVGRPVLCVEQECIAQGATRCRMIARLESEWGEEAQWAREALRLESVDSEIARREELVDAAQRAARRAQGALAHLSRRLKTELLLEGLIMESDAMQRVAKRARQVVNSDVSVLLVGESGTGRATLAKAIHHGGSRKSGQFEAIDCRGLSPTLLMQELSGFAQGAFAGASRSHTGAFQRAHRGTIFFDEITALTREIQGLILRVMEQGEVTPLGSPTPSKADVRVMAATQFDPLEKLASGELREDLYYALAIGRIDIPPLRERGEDILRLAQTLLGEARDRYDKPNARFSEDFKQALMDCSWPGNVRQLRNVIEYAVVFGPDRELGLSELPEDVLTNRWGRPSQDLSEDLIRAVLRRTKGNRSEAAELLNVGRTTLWRAMKRYGIE